MDDLALLMDLHLGSQRQGPGSDEHTRLAMQLAGLGAAGPIKAADIGCGTGASTLQLAQLAEIEITAVDFLAPFIDQLSLRAAEQGCGNKVRPVVASMEALPFNEGELDLIWSEGAIYNMGFANGLASWRNFLKPNGLIAVSEITWAADKRPKPIEDYWHKHYPEIATAGEKITVLEQQGYSPLGYFLLPSSCWWENYYQPLEAGFEGFLNRHKHCAEAQAIVDAEREEIALYQQYGEHYSYGMYIARKC